MTSPLEQIQLEPLQRLSGVLERAIRGRLWLQVLLAMVAGILVGVLLGPDLSWVDPRVSGTIVSWLALPGSLFLALIQMIVVPLVFASVVRGLAASDSTSELRDLGLGGVLFFVMTSALATGLGLALGLAVEPGSYIDPASVRQALGAPPPIDPGATTLPSLDHLPDLIVGLLPTNPLASMVGGQMLQVILFAVVIGVALVNLAPEKSAPLFDLLGSLQEVSMKVVAGAMRLAPIAVLGLVARLTAAVGLDVLAGMGVYVLTVLLGLLAMLGLYVGIVAVLAHRGPGPFLRDVREVMLLAFSTSSSAAVMPLSLATAEGQLGVRPAIARFLIPLGATINMSGTALYQGVATVFLAQVFDVPLGSSGLLLVVVMAVIASIGSPATPGAGIVILALVLEEVGIPSAGLALLLGVDRILDMSRTSVNVLGDLTACVVLERLSPGEPPALSA